MRKAATFGCFTSLRSDFNVVALHPSVFLLATSSLTPSLSPLISALPLNHPTYIPSAQSPAPSHHTISVTRRCVHQIKGYFNNTASHKTPPIATHKTAFVLASVLCIMAFVLMPKIPCLASVATCGVSLIAGHMCVCKGCAPTLQVTVLI